MAKADLDGTAFIDYPLPVFAGEGKRAVRRTSSADRRGPPMDLEIPGKYRGVSAVIQVQRKPDRAL